MLIPVRQLGNIGIAPDFPAQDLPLNGFTDALNVQFRHGRVQKMLGRRDTGVVFDDAPGGAPTKNYNPLWFQTWLFSGSPYVAFGTDSEILYSNSFNVIDGVATLQDEAGTGVVTPAPAEWQSDVYSDFCILNPRKDAVGPMYSFDQTGIIFRVIPGWGNAAASPGAGVLAPTGAANIVRSFKNHLVAVMTSDPYTLYWSNAGGPAAMPPDWTYDDPESLAGFKTFGANDGRIVDAVPLGDSLIIYTEFAAYAASLTKDNRVFDFRRLFSWGLINWDCCVQFESFHFCIGNGVIYTHDGSRIRRIADNKVEERFFDELLNYDRVHVAKHSLEHEIITYYAKESSVGTDFALLYNWLEGQGGLFSFESMDTPTYCIKPSILPPIDPNWNTYEAETGSAADWDAQSSSTSWDSLRVEDNRRRMFQLYAADLLSDTFISGNQIKAKWLRRDVDLDRDGTDFFAYVERRYLDFDEVTEVAASIKALSRAYLQITGSGVIDIQFGTSFALNDAVLWGPRQQFDIDAGDYKIDERREGRYLSYRIGQWPGNTPSSAQFQLMGMDWDMELEEGLR